MTVIRTALNNDSARDIELGEDGNGYMWKQIIPMDYTLTYQGKTLKFDRKYLSNVRTAFKENALGEQTAFQLADDDNSHYTTEDRIAGRNWDPERYRGEIVDMKVVNSGLYGKYKLTPEGLEYVKKNPKLGVSASLKEGYDSHNGKKYPVVMKHCLGTLLPKIKGMSPWSSEEVTLSDDLEENEEVLDLTMPTTETDEKVEVSKEWMDSVTEFMDQQKQFNTELADALGDDDDDDDDDDTSSESNLSDDDDDDDDPRLIELSERMGAAEKRALAAENKAAASEFQALAKGWKRNGVPKAMIDLAEPFLSVAGSFEIELSDGKKHDPREAMLKMLEEAEGLIDMSDEDGHGRADAVDENEDKVFDSIVEHDFMLDDF